MLYKVQKSNYYLLSDMVIHFSYVRVLYCDDYEEGLCCSPKVPKTEVTVTKMLIGGARMQVTSNGQNLPQKFNASQYSMRTHCIVLQLYIEGACLIDSDWRD